MSDNDQVKHFADELDKLVDRFRDEYELSFAAAVGALHMKAYLLCSEAEERGEEE